MSVEFTVTEDDYVRALQLSVRKRKMNIWVAIAVIYTLLIAQDVATGGSETAFFSAVAAIAAGFLLVVNLWVEPYLYRKEYRNYKLAHEATSLEFSDSHLSLRASFGHSEIPWDAIVKFKQNDDYLLVYIGPKLFIVIPKRISEEGFDIAGLERKLTEASTSED